MSVDDIEVAMQLVKELNVYEAAINLAELLNVDLSLAYDLVRLHRLMLT